jgi:hypothetical protein
MRCEDWQVYDFHKLLRLLPSDEGYVEDIVGTCCL